ncbi:unnamed protein product [Acanthosepion pharaonis]|uniref:Uncharacterized protein n=1 Tax=Acanthosepion pharaonis TaxID=158019 RepID=A0A812BWU6_ACAPH|nr:unnamed protein product [Sepia pharaonis]
MRYNDVPERNSIEKSFFEWTFLVLLPCYSIRVQIFSSLLIRPRPLTTCESILNAIKIFAQSVQSNRVTRDPQLHMSLFGACSPTSHVTVLTKKEMYNCNKIPPSSFISVFILPLPHRFPSFSISLESFSLNHHIFQVLLYPYSSSSLFPLYNQHLTFSLQSFLSFYVANHFFLSFDVENHFCLPFYIKKRFLSLFLLFVYVENHFFFLCRKPFLSFSFFISVCLSFFLSFFLCREQFLSFSIIFLKIP